MKNILSLTLSALLLFTACGGNISDSSSEQETSEVKVKEEFTFSEKIPEELIQERQVNFESEILQNSHSGDSFTIVAYPFDEASYFISMLGDYYKKRYSDAKIASTFKTEYKELSVLVGEGLPIFVTLAHTGGYNDNNTRTIDDKAYEFFFLENEKGDYIAATGQYTEGIYVNQLSNISQPISLFLTFPEDEVDDMMKNSEKLYLTFDGLDILPEDRVELTYPFINYYLEDFPQLATMMREMEEI